MTGKELPFFCRRPNPRSVNFSFSEESSLPKMSVKRIGAAENSSPQLQVFRCLFALACPCHSFLFFQKCEMDWLLVFVLWSLLTLPSVQTQPCQSSSTFSSAGSKESKVLLNGTLKARKCVMLVVVTEGVKLNCAAISGTASPSSRTSSRSK